MHRRSVLLLALSSVAAFGFGGPQAASAPYRLSGPIVHGNLAIYFVHGASAESAVPLTLQEAMTQGVVQVHETSNVNQLEIENRGNKEVFVQSGDIVKGGKQDRVLMVSLVLPPRSGRLSIASFCVEQGRWSARGREDPTRFSSSDAALPSRHAKMAIRGVRPAASAPGRGGDTGARQQQVWRSVSETQNRLSDNVGQSVAAAPSRSSLQLSLENDKLQEIVAAYVKALQPPGEAQDDIIGYVFAINGKMNSADLYPSNGLFRKMWPKLLKASATEAVAERNGRAEALPDADAVLAFLEAAEKGETQRRDLTAGVRLETREGEKSIYSSTERAGRWVHRSYLAKQ